MTTIGLIGNVDGNAPALEAVLTALQKEQVDQLLCLGNLFGRVPMPNECWELLSSAGGTLTKGFTEQVLTGENALTTTTAHNYKHLVEHSARLLGDERLKQLTHLDTEQIVGTTWLGNTSYHWLFLQHTDAPEAFQTVAAFNEQCTTFITPCDVSPFIASEPFECTAPLGEERIARKEVPARRVIGIGAVSSRDAHPGQACYAVLGEDSIMLRSVAYDTSAARQALLDEGPVGRQVASYHFNN